ncbi:MAG: response regulator [Clostridiales bacterium]|jgi:two-component system chemotaxis response regulator CheY|nr:response regulator [Clostridiales bacterium]
MKRVMVVDDAMFMRASLKMMLEKNGFEIAAEAENGAIAVQKYKEVKPDFVTMDITMPEMDGLQALKLIKQFDPDAKIVVVSAMGQEPVVKEAILSGAKSFIVKPFKEDFVLKTLNSL